MVRVSQFTYVAEAALRQVITCSRLKSSRVLRAEASRVVVRPCRLSLSASSSRSRAPTCTEECQPRHGQALKSGAEATRIHRTHSSAPDIIRYAVVQVFGEALSPDVASQTQVPRKVQAASLPPP